MEQEFIHVMAGSNESALASDLARAGFKVGPAGRMSGGLHVRVRADTQDEVTVRAIVHRAAPDATFGPNGSPASHLHGYREGL